MLSEVRFSGIVAIFVISFGAGSEIAIAECEMAIHLNAVFP